MQPSAGTGCAVLVAIIAVNMVLLALVVAVIAGTVKAVLGL